MITIKSSQTPTSFIKIQYNYVHFPVVLPLILMAELSTFVFQENTVGFMLLTFRNIAKQTIEIITAMMILLFVYTGVSKLIAQETFYKQISKVHFIGQYAHWIIWIIPIAELLIASLLLFRRTRLAGYYAFAFLMILFTIYIAAIIYSGNPLPCSCGGIIQQLTWQQHLVFNSCFTVLNIVVILFHNKSNKI